MSIIKTLGDTDLYKLTMGHVVAQHFPETAVTYALKVRSDVDWAPSDLSNIRREITALGEISFSQNELTYLETHCKYLPKPYLTFLKGIELNPNHVDIWLDNKTGQLQTTAKGLWFEEIYWETMILPIISECYFENRVQLTNLQMEEVYEKAKKKGKEFARLKCYFIDMGTRRRRSYAVHDAVIRGLIDGAGEFFLGTSNIHFAEKYNLVCFGTMAHEMFSAVAAMYGVENANNIVLGKWADTYHGDLGIALPDTFTTNFFLRTFNPFYAKLFDGLRHDSGAPLEWAAKVINHYKSIGIDPKSKKAIFSDGINSFDTIANILDFTNGQMISTFGIGTWLTNDFDDMKALNIVMKLIKAQKNQFEPCRNAVKLSDVFGKHMGDEQTIKDYYKRVA